MNQILSTSMPMDNRKNVKKSRNTQTVDVRNVLKFFGIAILVFGILMISSGVYAIYKNQVEIKENDLEPTISIENKTDTTILLKVMHQKVIAKVEYWWNNSEKTIINGNSGKYLDREITLPAGKNTLHVLIQDEEGKEITYDKEYETVSNINFEVSGNKIKITYEGNTLISYMTYRWDNDEEIKIDINDTTINKEIEAAKGLHELTVIVVDENNNTDTKTQKINGISKPKLEIDYDREVEHFVIRASDDEKLVKIEFRLNQDDNQVYVLNLEEMDLKELEYTLPDEMRFQTGENLIEVTVYNSNGLTEERGAKIVK